MIYIRVRLAECRCHFLARIFNNQSLRIHRLFVGNGNVFCDYFQDIGPRFSVGIRRQLTAEAPAFRVGRQEINAERGEAEAVRSVSNHKAFIGFAGITPFVHYACSIIVHIIASAFSSSPRGETVEKRRAKEDHHRHCAKGTHQNRTEEGGGHGFHDTRSAIQAPLTVPIFHMPLSRNAGMVCRRAAFSSAWIDFPSAFA